MRLLLLALAAIAVLLLARRRPVERPVVPAWVWDEEALPPMYDVYLARVLDGRAN